MAILHSERPSENSTEARIYDLLKDGLDDEWQLWHEPEIHRKEDEERPYRPDFVLLHRRHGMFVLEVKGWDLDKIKDVRTVRLSHDPRATKLLYEFAEGEQWVEAPFEQLAKYKSKIRKELKENKSMLGLTANQIDSIFEGAVAFANISSEDLEGPVDESFTDRLSVQRAMVLSKRGERGFFKSEIESWERCPAQIEIDLANPNGEFALSESQMDVMKGIVHPENVLPVASDKHISIHQVRPVIDFGAFIFEIMRNLRAKSLFRQRGR